MRTLLGLILLVSCQGHMAAADAAPAAADSSRLARGVTLDNVVVYGSRSNFGVASSQMSAVSLGQKQIMSVPVFFSEPDVLKAIQRFPGVQSGSDGTAGLFVRGGDYDQNYITIDGSAIYNAEHMRGFVSAINPDMVQNINFYRGAFPARYGSRLSSVVDIGLKDGDFNRYHGLLSVGILSSRIQAEGPIWKGHTSFNVAGRVSYFSKLARPILKRFYDNHDAMQPYSNMEYYDITAKLVHRFSEANRLSAVVYYGRDVDNESPSESHKVKDTVGDLDVFDDEQSRTEENRSETTESSWNNLLASLYFTSFVTPRHRLNVNLSYSQYMYNLTSSVHYLTRIDDVYRLYYLNSMSSRISNHSGVQDLALTADALLNAGRRHVVRYGAKLSKQWLKPTTHVVKDNLVQQFKGGMNWDEDLPGPISDHYTTQHSSLDYESGTRMWVNSLMAYAEDDYTIAHWLKLNYGLRLSSYFVDQKTYLALEPRASVRFKLAEPLALKLSYARMSQGIHRLTTNSLVMPSDIWVPVTKDVPLMTSDIYGAGLNYSWHGFDVAVEGYYKTLDNVLEYRNGATYFVANRNWRDIVAIGGGRSYGVELLVERKVGATTGWVSYTWSKSLRSFNRPGEELNGGRDFYASADHRNNVSVNLSHSFRLSHRLSLDLSAAWTYQTGRRGSVPYVVAYSPRLQEEINGQPRYMYGYFMHGIGPYVLPGNTNLFAYDFRGEEVPANPYQTYRDINDFKLPDTHHLDLNASLKILSRYGESSIGLGIYNVYNHYNVSNVYVGYHNGKMVLKGVCPFPFMPSLSLTHKF